MKHLISGLGFAMAFTSFSAASPLKVYILAGQSNMEGHAKLSSFDHIGMDPKTVPILEEQMKARRDVFGSPAKDCGLCVT